MWGAKRHGLVSAGMMFEPPSEQWGPHTTATVTWWYLCQCGQTYGTRWTFECDSDGELENLVNGAMSAVAAVFSRLAIAPPLQVLSTDLQSSLTRILTQLPEES
jgi:hypothetical protein